MVIYGKVEPLDICGFEVLLNVQETRLDKFRRELLTPSATSNVAPTITNNNSGRNGSTFGSY